MTSSVYYLIVILVSMASFSLKATQPLYYGDCVRLKNNAAKCYLHYEAEAPIAYLKDLSTFQATGDYNVSLDPFYRYNQISWWQVYKCNSTVEESFGTPVQTGDLVALKHVATKSYLSSSSYNQTSLSKLSRISSITLSGIETSPAWSSTEQWIIGGQEDKKSLNWQDSVRLVCTGNSNKLLAVTDKEHTSKSVARTGSNREIACRGDLQTNSPEAAWVIDAIFSMHELCLKGSDSLCVIGYQQEDFGTVSQYNGKSVVVYNKFAPKILHCSASMPTDVAVQSNKYLTSVDYKPQDKASAFLLNQDLASDGAHRIYTSFNNSLAAGYLAEVAQANRCEFVPAITDAALWDVVPTTTTTFRLRQLQNKLYLGYRPPSWTTRYGQLFSQAALLALVKQDNLLMPRQTAGGDTCLYTFKDYGPFSPMFSNYWKTQSGNNFLLQFSCNARYGVCIALSTQPTLFSSLGADSSPDFYFIIVRQQANTIAVSIFDNNFQNSVVSESYISSVGLDSTMNYWVKMVNNTLTIGIGDPADTKSVPLVGMYGKAVSYTKLQASPAPRFIGFSGFYQDEQIANIKIDGQAPAQDIPLTTANPENTGQSLKSALFDPAVSAVKTNCALFNAGWQFSNPTKFGVSFTCSAPERFMIGLSNETQISPSSYYVAIDKKEQTITIYRGVGADGQPRLLKKLYLIDPLPLTTQDFWIRGMITTTPIVGTSDLQATLLFKIGTGLKLDRNLIMRERDEDRLTLSQIKYVGFGGFDEAVNYSNITLY